MNRAEALRLLNLDSTATIADVRTAYHELSKKYHPDKNKDGVAHEVFIMIKKAHDYLSDSEIPTGRPGTPGKTAERSAQKPEQKAVPKVSKVSKVMDETLRKMDSSKYLHSLSDLPIRMEKMHEVCKKIGIDIMKISSTSHRPVKRTKAELWTSLVKTQAFKDLHVHSYGKLVELCEQKKIATNDKNDKPKPREELILDLILLL